MIRISLTEEKKDILKNIFRRWFFNRKDNMEDFGNVIGNDPYIRQIIFHNEERYKKWIKSFEDDTITLKEKKECQIILEDYFFAEFDNENSLRNYVVNEQRLRSETIDFFRTKYRNFRDSQGAKIVRTLNIKVCPYCNRNYIELYNYKDKSGVVKRIFKGELDHYYSQSKYPHLSLSLFNLIPCCKVCNHEKMDEQLKTFHPYYDSEENSYKFTLSTLTLEDKKDITFEEDVDNLKSKINDSTYLQGISDNFKIKIVSINSDYTEIINNSNLVFKLEKKYNNSKDYIKELLKKRYIYNDSYSEMLSENFKEIFDKPGDVKRVIFSNELNGTGHNERPLSKLTYDILKELDAL